MQQINKRRRSVAVLKGNWIRLVILYDKARSRDQNTKNSHNEKQQRQKLSYIHHQALYRRVDIGIHVITIIIIALLLLNCGSLTTWAGCTVTPLLSVDCNQQRRGKSPSVRPFVPWRPENLESKPGKARPELRGSN